MRKLIAMKIEVTIAEMLAVYHTQIAIADNMLSMGLSTKAVSIIQKVLKKTSTCDNCAILQVTTIVQQRRKLMK